jgi:hypothetical protein
MKLENDVAEYLPEVLGGIVVDFLQGGELANHHRLIV